MPQPRAAAAALFASGHSRADVARRLGIARSTAGAWYRRWRMRGAITAAPRGRRRRLSGVDADRLADDLLRSPRRAGFDLDRWSLAAVAAHIGRVTGLAYHPRHVTRLLRSAGFIVPPVGADARAALYGREVRGPDGTPLRLLVRAAPDAGPR